VTQSSSTPHPLTGASPPDARSSTPRGRAPERRAASTPFGPGVRLGRPFGFEVRADFSLLAIFVLVLLNLGLGVFPAWHPDWSPALRWGIAFGASVLFFASVLVHELSHAIVGRKLGIPVSGITLFMLGGLAHVEREPERPQAELLMAAVGPLSSIGIGLVTGLLAASLGAGAVVDAEDPMARLRSLGPLATLLLWLSPVNLILGIFNLLPGFPLDGGRVLRAALWWATGDRRTATRWASGVGQAFSWAFIAIGVLMVFGFRFPIFGGGPVQGIWLVLIGWFLSSAARASYRQLLVDQALAEVPVRTLMFTGAAVVPDDTDLDVLVHEWLFRGNQRCFAVTHGEEFRGLVCLRDIRSVPEARWTETRVESVMTPASELVTVSPSDDARDALRVLGERNVDQVPVVEKGRLLGFVRREDLLRWIALREGLV